MKEAEDNNQVWKKLFEGLCALLAINLFIIPYLYFSKLPAKIPVHFNFNGMPDSYGDKSSLFLLASLGFGLYLAMLFAGLLPGKYYNIPFKTSPEARIKIVKLIRKMLKVLRFSLLVFFNYALLGIILISLEKIKELGSSSFIILLLLILVPVIFMFVRMRKLAKE